MTRLLVSLLFAASVAAAEPQGKHQSTEHGDLPLPWEAREQTAAVVFDFDRDGKNDFVLASRKVAPAIVSYRRNAKGWDRVVIEPEILWVEAGGAVCDIDGDLDLGLGGDATSDELWWWKNPAPNFDRKSGGQTAQIVMSPGDVDGPIRIFECGGNAENPSDWRARALLDREMVHGHTLAVTDIDGDGNLDLFSAEMAQWGNGPEVNNPAATAWIWYGDGKGNFRRTVFQQGVGFHEARIADLNGDGRMDVLSKPNV